MRTYRLNLIPRLCHYFQVADSQWPRSNNTIHVTKICNRRVCANVTSSRMFHVSPIRRIQYHGWTDEFSSFLSSRTEITNRLLYDTDSIPRIKENFQHFTKSSVLRGLAMTKRRKGNAARAPRERRVAPALTFHPTLYNITRSLRKYISFRGSILQITRKRVIIGLGVLRAWKVETE